jgi:hypothetical protein
MSRSPVLESSWRYSMDEGIGGILATGRCERLTPRRLPDGYGDLAADHRRIARQPGNQHLEFALDHHSSCRPLTA